MTIANTVEASKITLSELMLPSHSNFSGKNSWWLFIKIDGSNRFLPVLLSILVAIV